MSETEISSPLKMDFPIRVPRGTREYCLASIALHSGCASAFGSPQFQPAAGLPATFAELIRA